MNGRKRETPSRRRVFLLIFLAFIYAGMSYGAVGDWKTYTNTNFIQQIHIVNDDVWCVTSGGVLQIHADDGTIDKFTNVDGLGWIDVLSVSADRLGKLWFGTNGGGVTTYHSDIDHWKTYTEFDGVAGKIIGAILATTDRVWVGAEEGVSIFAWNEQEGDYFWKENYLAERRVPVRKVRDFLDWNDEIWVATEEGIARARYDHPNYVPNLQDSASWTNYTQADGLSDNEVNCLVLADTMIWAGTKRGIDIFREDIWESRMEGMPSSTEVFDLVFWNNTLWAGTSQGLYKYNDQWTPELEGEIITSVDIDSIGIPWLGTADGGVMTFQDEHWIRYVTDGPIENNIERVVIDQQKNVWVTTIASGYYAQACRFAEEQWIIFDESDGLKTGQGLPGLFVDRRGRKWFGSWGDGVSVLDDGGTLTKEDDQWLHFDEENSALKGIIQNTQYVVITGIEQDRQGNFWFLNYSGVESGLVVCDSVSLRWTAYSIRDGLVYPEVQALGIDQGGIKWIGARQEGMSRFDDAGTPFDKEDDDPNFAWQSYSEDNADPARVITSDNVTSICVDDNNVVWIGTAAGIMRYTNFYFTFIDGLINESVNVIVPDARNNIWIGTNGGLSYYDVEIEEWTHFTVTNSGLVSNRVQDIAIDKTTGIIWVATDQGLNRFESGIIPPIITIESIDVYPNPFFPESTEEVLTFDGLPDGSQVTIFTISGERIREITMPRNQLNQVHWDGRNDHGSLVASGIYLFLVTNEVGLGQVGKFAVIR